MKSSLFGVFLSKIFLNTFLSVSNLKKIYNSNKLYIKFYRLKLFAHQNHFPSFPKFLNKYHKN